MGISKEHASGAWKPRLVLNPRTAMGSVAQGVTGGQRWQKRPYDTVLFQELVGKNKARECKALDLILGY